MDSLKNLFDIKILTAIVVVLAIAAYGIYQTSLAPEVVSTQTHPTEVQDVRAAEEGERGYELYVGPLEGDMLWVAWDARDNPPSPGDPVLVRIQEFETGETDIRVITPGG